MKKWSLSDPETEYQPKFNPTHIQLWSRSIEKSKWYFHNISGNWSSLEKFQVDQNVFKIIQNTHFTWYYLAGSTLICEKWSKSKQWTRKGKWKYYSLSGVSRDWPIFMAQHLYPLRRPMQIMQFSLHDSFWRDLNFQTANAFVFVTF